MRIYTNIAIVFLLLIFSIQILHAEDDTPAYQLVAQFNEGYTLDKMEVPFSMNPHIMVEGSEVRFVWDSDELVFKHGDLSQFTLEVIPDKPEVPTKIDTEEQTAPFVLHSGELMVYGKRNALLRIYDDTGRLIYEQAIGENGFVTVFFRSFQRGTYLVRCGNNSFKFLCK